MFNDSMEITDLFGNYQISISHSPPNSCQQTTMKGLVALQITGVNKHHLGQFKCKLLDPDTVLAVKDIPLLEDSMFFLCVLSNWLCKVISNNLYLTQYFSYFRTVSQDLCITEPKHVIIG